MCLGFWWSSEAMMTENWFSRGEAVSRYVLLLITVFEVLSFILLTIAYDNGSMSMALLSLLFLNRLGTGLCIGWIETCVNVLVLRWFDEGPMELGMKACYHTLRIRMHGVFSSRLLLVPFACLIGGRCDYANYSLLPGIVYAAKRDEKIQQEKNAMAEETSTIRQQTTNTDSAAMDGNGNGNGNGNNYEYENNNDGGDDDGYGGSNSSHRVGDSVDKSEHTPLINKASSSPRALLRGRSGLSSHDSEGGDPSRFKTLSPRASTNPNANAQMQLDGYHSSRNKLVNRESRIAGTPKLSLHNVKSPSAPKEDSAEYAFPDTRQFHLLQEDLLESMDAPPMEYSLKDWYNRKFEGFNLSLGCDILFLAIYFGIFFAFVMLSSEMIVRQYHYTTYTANLLLITIPGVSVIPTRFVGTSVNKLGSNLFMIIACLCFCIAFSLFAYLKSTAVYLPIIVVALFIFGSECFISTGYDELFRDIPLHLQGAVSNLSCGCNYLSAMLFCIIFGVLADESNHKYGAQRGKYVGAYSMLVGCSLINCAIVIVNQYFFKRHKSKRAGYEQL
ncbi:hypothetical protein RFI_27485 [Reticulomyxa filosa]|uniref:Uncharacterized protein n=1 Tax=Reticulomyxa filosa TaxID=46433 RepID=X6M7F0_RETFI|nr:hypothetical protein RFI_27485 [Reticulomyxa filosa]|eukprot:ETO09893.1 hypothetical protein RFI_27485 [Reticulomyxa filosa]